MHVYGTCKQRMSMHILIYTLTDTHTSINHIASKYMCIYTHDKPTYIHTEKTYCPKIKLSLQQTVTYTDIHCNHALTLSRLYLLASPKSRPISVPMYQPLKGIAGNSIPPTSKATFDTAGSAYQRIPSSSNQSYL